MVKARKAYMEIRYLSSVIKIQSAYRGYLARRDKIRRNRKIALIQGLWRRKKAIRLLKELKVEAKSVGKLQETNYALENKVINLSQDLQQKNKERKELLEKFSQMESQLSQFKEKVKKMEISRKSVSAEAAMGQLELKKQVALFKEMAEESKNANKELTALLKEKDRKIDELEDMISKDNSKLAPRLSIIPTNQSDQVSSLQKEVAGLKEEIARLLSSKYKADSLSESRKSEADKSLVSPRSKQVFAMSSSPYMSGGSAVNAIPEIKVIKFFITYRE